MNISEVRKVVGRLKASLFKRANSHSIGMLKTNVRGTGLQFKEHQVYTHGDDVRFIDWKILAKTSHPYVKTFVEERNLETKLIPFRRWHRYDHRWHFYVLKQLDCCSLSVSQRKIADLLISYVQPCSHIPR